MGMGGDSRTIAASGDVDRDAETGARLACTQAAGDKFPGGTLESTGTPRERSRAGSHLERSRLFNGNLRPLIWPQATRRGAGRANTRAGAGPATRPFST